MINVPAVISANDWTRESRLQYGMTGTACVYRLWGRLVADFVPDGMSEVFIFEIDALFFPKPLNYNDI